jgi:hypothetical protein
MMHSLSGVEISHISWNTSISILPMMLLTSLREFKTTFPTAKRSITTPSKVLMTCIEDIVPLFVKTNSG